MKKLFLAMLAVVLCAGSLAFGEGTYEFDGRCIDIPQYDGIEEAVVSMLGALGMKNVVVYDSADLTPEILRHRRGKTVVERCIGIVTDMGSGDGVVLNEAGETGNYIGYRSVNLPFQNGSIILSYMVYDPNGECEDGIVDRYDFILNDWQGGA